MDIDVGGVDDTDVIPDEEEVLSGTIWTIEFEFGTEFEELDKHTTLERGNLETSTEDEQRTALEGNGTLVHKVPSESL